MKKERIPLSGHPSGIQSPFVGLEISGLPPGPDPVQDGHPEQTKMGKVVLRREKSHRGGKTVVVVSGFSEKLTADDLDGMARQARQHCGCGGTVREREIELQGDQPDRVRKFFESIGFLVGGVKG